VSTRFTPLESEVLDALAWDLREIAPDLAGQFAESLPGVRRNTGAGLFTEIIVDRSRPTPLTTPTGRFGTVHAMVGDLPDPVAFQVELRAGQLIALHGDAYGQDTRAIDFARIPYDQVFTVDEHGESIAFDPAALMQPSPLLDLHQHADHEPSRLVEPVLQNQSALQRVQEPGADSLVELLFGKVQPAAGAPVADQTPPDKVEQTSVVVGLWVIITVVGFFAVAFFDFPIFFAVFLAITLGRLLHMPKVVEALTRAARRLGRYEYRPPQR
jgi:hypothetical protein